MTLCQWCYRDVSHDALSPSEQQGDVEWPLVFSGLIVDLLHQRPLIKLDDAVRVPELLNLEEDNSIQ